LRGGEGDTGIWPKKKKSRVSDRTCWKKKTIRLKIPNGQRGTVYKKNARFKWGDGKGRWSGKDRPGIYCQKKDLGGEGKKKFPTIRERLALIRVTQREEDISG